MKLNIVNILSSRLSLKDIQIIIKLFGILILCCIWGLLFHRIDREREIEINSAIKETSNLARAFEEHTLRTIENADQAVLFLKYQYEMEGKNIDIPRYMREGRFADQTFLLMSIIDENGNLAASSQSPLVPLNLADREHFLVHKNSVTNKLFIGKPVLGRVSGNWSIQMTRRIDKPDGSFGGVIVVSMDPFYFSEFYKQINLGKNSSITLVGLDGIVRARQSDQNTEIGQSLKSSFITERLLNNSVGHLIAKSSVDGIKRIVSYRVLSDYSLAVMVGIDETEALRGFNHRVTDYYLLACLGTIVVIFFVLLLLQTVKHQRQDKEMLKQAYDAMETKVLLRTKELFLANEELASTNENLQKAYKHLERKNEEIRKIAYSDALTGLPNRLDLNDRIMKELDKASRGEAFGSVMFIDLDDFKTINDVFGHSNGDALIIAASRRIVAKAGNGAFVARIGGDEFVVILPGINDRARIAETANEIVKALYAEYKVCDEVFMASASIGIAIYPEDGATADEILKNADNAMYSAKQDKNRWCFYEAVMQEAVLEKMLLRNSLRNAVERQELFLEYQPQAAAGNSSIFGFEVLVRWNSPEHGLVLPNRFIPLAEQSGLIQHIGAWVLKEACRFAGRLAASGYGDLYVAVNISAKQIAADNFVSNIRSIINEAGVQPCQIELEITESFFMISMEDAIQKLLELRSMGIRLSLDDFGTGFSSLTYLWNLPVNTLKIDKTFTDIILKDRSKANIISSIIKMAHDLNMVVVAEGVENREQYEYLLKNSCDLIQGYYLSKPVSEPEAIRLLASN